MVWNTASPSSVLAAAAVIVVILVLFQTKSHNLMQNPPHSQKWLWAPDMVSPHPGPLPLLQRFSRKINKIKIRPVSIYHPFIHPFFYLTMSDSRYTSYTGLAMFVWDILFFQRIKVPLPAPTSGSSQPLVTPACGIPTPSSGLWMYLQSCTQIHIQPHTHTNTQSHTQTHTSHILTPTHNRTHTHIRSYTCNLQNKTNLSNFWVVSLNCHLDTQLRSKVDRSKSLRWRHNCEKHYNSHLILSHENRE